MNKNLFTAIIIAAAISLIGVVYTQLHWVKKAIDLKEEQFNSSVRLAMKSVVNQILDSYNKTTLQKIKAQGAECNLEVHNITDVVKQDELQHLLKQEMGCMQVCQDYEYAVYNTANNEFTTGSFKNYKNDIVNSIHNIPLTCLFKKGQYKLGIFFPKQKSRILMKMSGWLGLSALFTIILIFSFWYVIHSLLRQKKLSEMKTDFVNNMTHEFKTPISTIFIASEMLLKPDVIKHPEKTKKYARVILDENSRLQNQVEQVLQIAVLDKKEAKIKPKHIDVHELVEQVLANFKLSLQEKNGKITTNLAAVNTTVFADETHVLNIFSNLLDNALKYSETTPEITVATRNEKNTLVLSVSDKGIGISPEHRPHVFKKLYRVPTGNIHNVKGFGIGLYYVKMMMEAHGGFVTLYSEQGKGSRFDLHFPQQTA